MTNTTTLRQSLTQFLRSLISEPQVNRQSPELDALQAMVDGLKRYPVRTPGRHEAAVLFDLQPHGRVATCPTSRNYPRHLLGL